MAKQTITTDVITVKMLEQAWSAALPDDIQILKPELMTWRDEFMRRQVVQFRGYVLADHMEHKEANYVHMTLPKWLKWLDRFVIKEERMLTLDAWHTYPLSNTKAPELGKGYVQFIKSDWEAK